MSPCRVCGRALDDMGTCVCATERRKRDEPGLVGAMAQDRRGLDQAEKRAPCPDCEGSGRVAVHICRTERECRRLCLRVEVCITCDGSGKKPKRG